MAETRTDLNTRYLTRFRTAQKFEINWEDILDPDLFKFVYGHSKSLCCSAELLMMPLISAVSSCMGPHTTVHVNSDWSEKIVLWCVIAARRGERKTTVLNKVKQENIALEQEIRALHSNNSNTPQPRVIIDETTLTDIREHVINTSTKSDSSSLLVLLDDLGSIVRNTENPKRLWDFAAVKRSYIGSSVCDSAITDIKNNQQPFVNFVATVQAFDLPAIIDQDDPDGLVDRALLLCAKDVGAPEVKFSSSSSYNPPSLQTLLSSIRNYHQVQRVTYTFSPDGETQLERCFGVLQKLKDTFSHNENCRGAINFAFGHLVRLCGVFSALKNGLAMANRGSFIPVRVIDQDTIRHIFSFIRCLLQQKFVLMGVDPVEIESSLLQSSSDVASMDRSGMGKVTTSGASEYTDDDVIEITVNDNQTERINNKVEGSLNTFQIIDMETEEKARYRPGESDVMILRDGYTETYQSSPRASQHTQPVFPNQMPEVKTMSPGVHYGASMPAMTPMGYGASNETNINVDTFDRIREEAHSYEHMMANPHKGRRPGPRPQQMFVNRSETKVFKSNVRRRFPSYKSFQKGERIPCQGYNLYKMTDSDFVFQCGPKIRKLLLTTGNIITASYACQYRLFPPIPIEQRVKSPRTTHPAWAAAKFFEKLQGLGFGTLVIFRGQSVKFIKKRYEEMTEEAKQYFQKIRVPQEVYEKSFSTNVEELTVDYNQQVQHVPKQEPQLSSHDISFSSEVNDGQYGQHVPKQEPQLSNNEMSFSSEVDNDQ